MDLNPRRALTRADRAELEREIERLEERLAAIEARLDDKCRGLEERLSALESNE